MLVSLVAGHARDDPAQRNLDIVESVAVAVQHYDLVGTKGTRLDALVSVQVWAGDRRRL